MPGAGSSVRGVAAHEIEKFRQMQTQWWNPTGPLRSLHLFNPVRVRYISDVLRNFGTGVGGRTGGAFLSPSLQVLDVGCGGGILSESLARLGASVTGIDMCDESVVVADQRRQTALAMPSGKEWASRLKYVKASLFDVAAGKETSRDVQSQYDLVVASEVIEHVSDARGFLSALCEATKPGGVLVLSTMDKSVKTYLSHIVAAEHLTGVVTPGTHDWTKFIPPQDMTDFCARPGNDVQLVDLQYIVTYPDVCQSLVARNFEINFTTSARLNTGHYFWAGVKSPKATLGKKAISAGEPAPAGKEEPAAPPAGNKIE
uniref:Ubiquinone biosynthesis O-methyltransferase, mitochondrial n=1 Tax=Herpetomonas muscarum TaxID=5718 RepID=T1YS58_HERMU|nr:2-polyprenyl-6-hydroxyphenyl methylase/3-demethylubiquinone-9 3-methyltransferase [Herpetomonas muscarum]